VALTVTFVNNVNRRNPSGIDSHKPDAQLDRAAEVYAIKPGLLGHFWSAMRLHRFGVRIREFCR
jgi:hypothetical protein